MSPEPCTKIVSLCCHPLGHASGDHDCSRTTANACRWVPCFGGCCPGTVLLPNHRQSMTTLADEHAALDSGPRNLAAVQQMCKPTGRTPCRECGHGKPVSPWEARVPGCQPNQLARWVCYTSLY